MYVKNTLNPIEKKSSATCTREIIKVDKNHRTTQHVHDATMQNNILDLVISTEEQLIVNLKIIDKIGDHQAIQYSIKIEN